jgi:hypothetical protein
MQLVARYFAWLLSRSDEWEIFLGIAGVEPGHLISRQARARGRSFYETEEEAI